MVAPIPSTSHSQAASNPEPIPAQFNERHSKILGRKYITTYPVHDRKPGKRRAPAPVQTPTPGPNRIRSDRRHTSDFRGHRRHHAWNRGPSMPVFDGVTITHEDHRQLQMEGMELRRLLAESVNSSNDEREDHRVRPEVPMTTQIQAVPPAEEVEAPALEEIAAMPPLEVLMPVTPPPAAVLVERCRPQRLLPADPRVTERSATPEIPLEPVAEVQSTNWATILASINAISALAPFLQQQMAPVTTIKLDGPPSAPQ